MTPATAEDPPRAVSEVPTMVLPIANDPEMQMRGSQQDPSSIASISAKTQVLQGQSIADSIYDAPVPPARKAGAPTVSGFQNRSNGGIQIYNVTDNLFTKICCLIIAIALILIISYVITSKGSIKSGSMFGSMYKSILKAFR
jgi:hypothetical protein